MKNGEGVRALFLTDERTGLAISVSALAGQGLSASIDSFLLRTVIQRVAFDPVFFGKAK